MKTSIADSLIAKKTLNEDCSGKGNMDVLKKNNIDLKQTDIDIRRVFGHIDKITGEVSNIE